MFLHGRSSVVLPSFGVVLGTTIGLGLTFYAEPFLLFRLCRGNKKLVSISVSFDDSYQINLILGSYEISLCNTAGQCDDPSISINHSKAIMILAVPTLLFHLPSSICYLLIYCLVKKHQVRKISILKNDREYLSVSNHNSMKP